LQAAPLSFNQICVVDEQLGLKSVLLKDMRGRPAASLPAAAPQHQRTEATLAQHLPFALTTASMTMQLTAGGIIFGHAYGQIMDTGATDLAVLISI